MPKVKPLVVLSAALLIASCSDDPTAPRQRGLALMAIVEPHSGNAFEPMPLVVRLTDGNGNGIPNVRINWQIVGGSLELWEVSGHLLQFEIGPQLTTGPAGHSAVMFRATRVEPIKITASIDPPQAGSRRIDFGTVQFAVEMTGAVLLADYWGEEATVPVGTLVTWVNTSSRAARIRSTSEPTDGSTVAATLEPEEQFQFVPEVPGVWEWTWSYVEATGELQDGGVALLTAEQL